MSRVWEIIEHRKDGDRESYMHELRKRYSGSRMSDRREDSDEYRRGIEKGFCAAIEMLSEVAESFE